MRNRWIMVGVLIAIAALLLALFVSTAAAIALIAGGVAVAAGTPPGRPATSDNAEPAPPAASTTAPVIEAIAEPVLVVSGNRVTEANSAARALLGDHILGEDVRLAIRHPAATERLADVGGDQDGEGVALIGLGVRDQRWEMRVSPVESGRRIVQLIDRTGSYAAERMRVDFVASASHELKTPLASILGFVETLSDPEAGGDPDLRARFLKIMAGEAARMQRLIDDLLSLSRIEAEKYLPPADRIDLAALAGEVVRDIVQSGVASAEIVLDAPTGLAAVPADRAQLSQVLHNLIGNAIKYGRAGTPVTVKLAQPTAATLRITVADQGDGVAPEHIPRLTERFYRVDPGRSRTVGGTGLGLAIVKHIAERHRGRLDITSVRGMGTSVTLLLPTAPGGEALSSKRHDGAPSAERTEPEGAILTTGQADPNIGELRGLIAEMGGLAEASIGAAVDALRRRDLVAAQRVIAGDRRIDILESEVERLAVSLIALRAPTGEDLREAVAALKIASVVERIGDYAKNIAKRVAAIDEGGEIEPLAMLPAMARMASALVHDVLDAFAARDAEAAVDVSERDRAIDDFYNSIFRVLVTYMMENPKSIGEVAHLLFIAKNLERVGDHATNVAEMVYYAATGAHMAERERGGRLPLN